MEDTITMWLRHLRVNVITRVTEFSDLLSQQFNALSRVTEYYRLIDLKLGEEGVQTMHFLLFLHVGIILCDTLECKLVHQVDFIWFPLAEMFLLRNVVECNITDIS